MFANSNHLKYSPACISNMYGMSGELRDFGDALPENDQLEICLPPQRLRLRTAAIHFKVSSLIFVVSPSKSTLN
jgi:hypothetical protein